ncbi:MAG: glycosyltransferase family 4 protein [Chloroflexi bacterium]|nr:glycosyltransferase family 4 protein [Chloroflexota bacterium]
MHILIINSEYPPIGGGASNASAEIARSLVKLGQQVTVLTAAYHNLPSGEEIDDVRIVRMPAWRRKSDRSTTAEQISFMLSASFLGLWQIRRLRPDVALAFFGAPSGVAAWFWSFFFGLPYVVSLRGGDVPGFRPYDFARQHRLLGPLLRRVWRRAAAVVANSEGLRQLGGVFEPRVPIRVIPNGVDLDKFQAGDRVWAPARLLFVGRVVYQKGLDLILNALSALKTLDWRLEIVGDGPRVDRLRAQADELGIVERVSFPGWQSREILPSAYRRANLFVYPSRHEGMPNAVLEAMASGLPVLASRIAGNEELVTEEAGLLVPPEDVQALKSALVQLIPDASARERMGAAARKRVEAQYSWRKVAQAYLDLMNSIVESR